MCGYLHFQQDIEDAVRSGKEAQSNGDDEHNPFAVPDEEGCAGAGYGNADEKKPYTLGEAAARTIRVAGYTWAWVIGTKYPQK
ncbi:hypothetical protein FHL15_003529 [Xylaria flabelliformis]|uniref:Uncharacterized protein n=1 Tax=Xylaria flabelliformis TaxID=2512241 RepID=A0A553I5T7_9PEZI|nr:hypothetical protein FHL15_003529 [Xylaria flabelliformis]